MANVHLSRKKLDVYLRHLLLLHLWKVINLLIVVAMVIGYLLGNGSNVSMVNKQRIDVLESQVSGISDYINSTYRLMSDLHSEAKAKGESEKVERYERLMKTAEELTKEKEQE